MKKLIHKIFCYTKRIVQDMDTKQTQIATYYLLFGLVIKITYKSI
ncbi:hypothetical protein PG614_10255 [Riemerella anatipestifer]|nr:hypothetical protein [Riemerella anatipestifer]MDY3534258.1 hypothetical protein [Riemerella anatipestifer]MDY3536328.1 hypothetical protein [Riemerella anatipestifer]